MTTPAGEPSSAGTDPNAQSGAGAPGTDPGTGTGAQSGATTPTEPTGQPASKTAAELQAELDAVTRRMQAADQNTAKAQAELKKLQDAQLSEADKLKRDYADAQTTIAKLQQDIKDLRIQNSFMVDNTYKWQDPSAALKLADLTAVEIDDKGTVKGLKDVLKAVADTYPWMLKKDDDGGTGTPPAPTGSTGPAGRPPANPSGTARSDLEKKYPAMRGRVST